MNSPPASSAAQTACLADDYRRIRRTTDRLVEPLSPEDAALQSMPLASPAKWHLAHTAWFFDEFVLRPASAQAYRPFDPAFGRLFNSYYEQVGPQWPREQRGLVSRPSLSTVLEYRDWVDQRVLRLLESRDGACWHDRIELGLQHEQQHQELLLTDVKHLLSLQPSASAYVASPVGVCGEAQAAPLRMIDFEGGLRFIGAGSAGFAFDAERPRHRQCLEPYAMADRLVTNAEYREFIEDRGYSTPALWLADGWAACCEQKWQAPMYWSADGPSPSHFTLGGWQPIDPHAPVIHVSLYEADAFARWAGSRLPTEAEWESAARGVALRGPFAESQLLAPPPAQPRDPPSLQQMYGCAWQWTSSAFAPYPGFRPLNGALGEYNGKFMANQFVLRGGSCVTPTGHVRPSYRNFFHADARWQFTGIRLAKDRTE